VSLDDWAAYLVRESTRRQGLPEQVEDSETLLLVARVIGESKEQERAAA
jgi:hypothetical protein